VQKRGVLEEFTYHCAYAYIPPMSAVGV